jgi:putative SOS response-associated peptidase YedK
LVPADGFYEWQARGKTKKPFRIARRDGEAFAFAGLWESWVNPNVSPINRPNDNHATVDTYTIATVVASPAIAHIHYRMPVILVPEDHHAWLRGDPAQALSLLRPLPDAELQSFEVSPRVGDIRNDDASLMAPCQEREPTLF